jgi:hypothetical protein
MHAVQLASEKANHRYCQQHPTQSPCGYFIGIKRTKTHTSRKRVLNSFADGS